MTEKFLGKITKVRFGRMGYQECQFGLALWLDIKGWGGSTVSITGGWCIGINSEKAQWNESDRDQANASMCRHVDSLLGQAKVSDVHQLLGKPVEVEADGMTLKDWRILTEVL